MGFVTKPCVSQSVMIATCCVTFWIIGGGFVLCGPAVLGENYLAWGASIALTLEVLLSFYRGHVTKSLETYEGEGETCEKCNKTKKITTHHCSACRACIDDMDHHCLFLNNCIGSNNLLYFLRFVFWVACSCYYVAVAAAYTLIIVNQFTISNFTFPENKRMLLAMVLAFPTALLPAAAPTLGIKKSIILTVAMSSHMGAITLGLAKGSWPVYFTGLVIGTTASWNHLDMFFNCSIGLITVVLIVVTLVSSDGYERLLIVLAVSATGVALLTSFLFVGSFRNVLRGVRTFETIWNMAPQIERPKGLAGLKDLFGGSWALWKLFL